MALFNLITDHFTDIEISNAAAALQTFETIILSKCRNLTPEESSQYGSIDEQMKLFINKVLQYHNTQPALDSPDVDWTEFMADAKDRNFLEASMMRLAGFTEVMKDTKILHDHDNFQNGLLDKKYAKYKADTGSGGLWEVKSNEYAQFFTP